MCGDFNSTPLSSTLSALHCEDIEDENSSWNLTKNKKEVNNKQEKYKKVNSLYLEKRKDNLLEPLAGRI